MDTSSWPEAMLLDDLLDCYVDWRASARAVADAYARWSFASGPERALRFAGIHRDAGPGAEDRRRICGGGDRRRAVAAAVGL